MIQWHHQYLERRFPEQDDTRLQPCIKYYFEHTMMKEKSSHQRARICKDWAPSAPVTLKFAEVACACSKGEVESKHAVAETTNPALPLQSSGNGLVEVASTEWDMARSVHP